MAKMTWRGEEWRRRVAKQAALGMERGMALAVDVAEADLGSLDESTKVIQKLRASYPKKGR